MKSLRMIFIALTSIALLSACDRGGGSSSKASPPKSSQAETQNKAPSSQEKQTAGAEAQPQTKDQARLEPKPSEGETTVIVPPSDVTIGQEEPATGVGTGAPDEGIFAKTYKSLTNTWDTASNQVSELATDVGEGFGEVQDATRSLVAPTYEENLRSRSFDEISKHSTETRDQEILDAEIAMAASKATPLEEVTMALKPTDEVTNLLVAMIAEPQFDKVREYSNQLVDEIFNEPEVAKIKVMKLQLGLRELSEQGVYDEDISDRVAYLQALLDEKIQKEGQTTLVRDSLIVAGTSITLGAIAGLHGFDGIRRYMSDFSIRRSLSSAKEGVKSAGQKVGSLFRSRSAGEVVDASEAATKAWAARTGFRRGLATFRLSSDKVVQRDIVALGLKPDEAKDLSLKVVPRSSVGFQEYNATNMPGLRYAVVDQWENASLNERRRIIFAISRPDHLSARPVTVASRLLPSDEANAIARKLEFKAPEEGGKDFAVIIDKESGVATPTRVTVNELEESGASLKPKAKPRSPRARKTVAKTETEIESITSAPAPAATASAEEVVTAPVATADEAVAAGTSAASNIKTAGKVTRAARSIGTRLRNFKWSWAATVAAATEIPFQGFLMEGYRAGKKYGGGHDALYLENLIPADRLDKLSLELNESASQ